MGTNRNSSTLFPFALLIAGSIGVFYCYGCYAMVKSVRQAYLLSSRGVRAAARVSARTPVWFAEGNRHPQGDRRYLHDVEFDGHEGSIILGKEMPVGTEISVLYLPDSPEIYVPGEASERFDVLWLRMPAGGFSEKFAIGGSFLLLIVGLFFSMFQGIRFVGRVGRKLWSGASAYDRT